MAWRRERDGQCIYWSQYAIKVRNFQQTQHHKYMWYWGQVSQGGQWVKFGQPNRSVTTQFEGESASQETVHIWPWDSLSPGMYRASFYIVSWLLLTTKSRRWYIHIHRLRCFTCSHSQQLFQISSAVFYFMFYCLCSPATVPPPFPNVSTALLFYCVITTVLDKAMNFFSSISCVVMAAGNDVAMSFIFNRILWDIATVTSPQGGMLPR